MAMNLASKYAQQVDERFYRDSQVLMATNKDYEWTGVNTVNVYQVDTVPLTDYTRAGANRYGQPSELGNTIQSMTLTQDKSFTFTIDKGNKLQTQMVMDAGKSLAREQREVVVPTFDTYVFGKMAGSALTNPKGKFVLGAASSSNAYSNFLKAGESMGNDNVPDSGRIAFCSYGFCNLLMLDPAFIKYSDKSQDMVIKGVLGEVDGTKIVKVPKSRLPFGCSFLVAHPSATVAPQQLTEYKTHENPPGISGWLVEGRHIYDAFVLNGKADALFLGLLDGALGSFSTISVEGSTSGKTVIKLGGNYTALPAGYTAYIKAASGTAPSVTYGSFDATGWTSLTFGTELSLTDGYKYTVAIVADGYAVAASTGDVNAA